MPKDKPFTLIGADGVTYNPSMPHDPLLPPGESINCHCMLGRVTNDDILGLSLDERKALRDQAREEIGDEWKYELDSENKAKAGINEETIKLDWLKQKSKSGQIKYLGSKIKYELVDIGAIKNDNDLFKTVKTSSGKITVQKTLQEIRQSGIMTATPTEKAEYSYYLETLGKNAPESIEDYVKLRSNPSEWNMFVPYAKSIEKGGLTPLADFKLYKEQRNEIYSKLVGTTTSDGLKITGSTYHYIDRTIGSVEQRRSGVNVDAAYKALTNPLEIRRRNTSAKGGSTKYFGENCSVSVNIKTGKLIQTNPVTNKEIRKMATFKITAEQIEVLKKYVPDLAEKLESYTHINDFLDELDDKILDIGFTDETYDYLNETGRKLERLYDQVFNQNE